MPRPRCADVVLCSLLLLGSGLATAGSLAPPAGPVRGTMKPLTDIEPRIAVSLANTPGDADSVFRITEPGSYYLVANVQGVAGAHGVEIASHGVSLDLGGFSVIGAPGAKSGVALAMPDGAGISVSNGSVRGWTLGLDLAPARGARVTGVQASWNTSRGITVGESSVLAACVASDNGDAGILAAFGSSVSGCSAFGNGGSGIQTGDGCTIASCNASTNEKSGFLAGAGSLVEGCVARANRGAGFAAMARVTLRGSTATFNGADGFEARQGCVIVGNTSALNGWDAPVGAGVRLLDKDAHVEGNACTRNEAGIVAVGAGNFILRNSCAGNGSNWSIAPGNSVAPIVQAPVNGAPIVGNSYDPGPGAATNPNANVTH